MIDYAALPTNEIERMSHNIRPGEWVVEAERPISTLLGSCVAVCLYDPVLRLAGMNHFMPPKMKSTKIDEDSLLAGDASMTALYNGMLARGATKHRLCAKAFGGGAVIDTTVPGALNVGKRNVDFAHQWLDQEGIPIVASDFLGPWSRKILFVPATGDAYCKRVTSRLVSQETMRREEQAYADFQASRAASISKKIELF